MQKLNETEDQDYVNYRNINDTWDLLANSQLDGRIMLHAIKHKKTKLIKAIYKIKFPWDPFVTASAALAGNLKLLEFLYDERCPIDDLASYYAARKNHLHILKWLRDKKIELHYLVPTLLANNGNITGILWYNEQYESA